MLLRRLARTLAVAGACGLAPAAFAQTGIPLPPLTQPSLTQAATQTAPTPTASAASRLEVMKVEVALLADPGTYAQPVEVRLDNDTILLIGQVEDEVTRKRILEVARQHCYLPVSDAMSTVARTGNRAVVTAPLQATARDALVRQMGSIADRFQILTTEDGKVTLRGEVGSAEEKVTASKALRGLPGCTRVVNGLTIRTIEQAGLSTTVVSADGHSAVTTPTQPQRVVYATPLQRVQASEEIEPSLPRYVPSTPTSDVVSSGLPNTRTVNVTTRHNGKEVTRPVMYVMPTASGYSTHTTVKGTPVPVQSVSHDCPTTTFHEGVTMHESPPVEKKRSFLRSLFAWKSLKLRKAPTPELTAMSPMGGHNVVIPPAHPVYMPQMTTGAAQPIYREVPQGVTRPAYEKVVPRQVVETVVLPTQPEQVVQAPPVVSTLAREVKPAPEMVVPQPAPTIPVVAAPAAPSEAWPPAHDTRPVTATPPSVATPYRSRPLAGLAARTQPRPVVEVPAPVPVAPVTVPAPAPAPVAKPAPLTQTVASQPAATMEPGTLAPMGAPEPMRMTTRELIDRIKATCGKLVRDVKVESTEDRKILVHVYAKPATDHLIVGKLLQMPELAATNVRLQLHLTN